MNIPDITLVNASFGAGISGWQNIFIPLGPLYLTSYLEQQGFSVDFRDYQINTYKNPFDPQSLSDFVSSPAKVVGFSCYIDLLPLVISTCKRLKEKQGDVFLVLGGPGPAGVAGNILQEFPFVDAVVLGEGEETLAELLRQKENPVGVPGVFCRKGQDIHYGETRPRIKNLDALPLPAYKHIDNKRYCNAGPIGKRGCPYRCSFCSNSTFWGNRSVFRDAEQVALEMKLLVEKYGFRQLVLIDDIPMLNRDWFEKLLAAIRRLTPEIKWACWGRINLVDKNLLEEMSRSGCVEIGYGLESASDSILTRIGKNFTFDKAMEVIRYSLKCMNVRANLIWGFPFETWGDFSKTCLAIGTIRALGCSCRVMPLIPVPQSALFLEYGERIIFNDLSTSTFISGYLAGFRALEDDTLGPMALIKRYPEIFPVFYYYPTECLKEKVRTITKIYQL